MSSSAPEGNGSAATRKDQSHEATTDASAEASTSGRPAPSADAFAIVAAAIMVQRMYRGYRERRRLADIALLEQEKGWCVFPIHQVYLWGIAQ